ncbi:P-loop containing nucleoside triphosphate hydrolase protein [Sistotremastrum suecicum HHB10207 ss-3]|uniref:p-loop containing nucleoside triphosphate hydrolase protein n=1 Tax=Sistotremastrum suecicum HHB10207 ss-3 TaxID=1314776 RepID=A0A166IQ61_9AGAM|nr:P-loop containing nucleoside triphosphate hydrolase protein [Sistotremastrum suecicum HHB10207 ss-3]
MLDHCSISHKGGAVLWSRSFTPAARTLAASAQSPVNSLIREALIEGRTSEEKYDKDGYAIKWTFLNEMELIFVVAYQRILQLTYIDDLLEAIKTLFLKMFEPFLTTFVASLHAVSSTTITTAKSLPVGAANWDFRTVFQSWDRVFDQVLKGLEAKAASERSSRLKAPAAAIETPPADDSSVAPTLSSERAVDEQAISRNVAAMKSKMRGGSQRAVGRKGAKNGGYSSGYGTASGNDSDTPGKKKASKVMRKWGDQAPTESDMASLDFSYTSESTSATGNQSANWKELVDEASLGVRGRDGSYEVKDWEFTEKGDLVSQTLATVGKQPGKPEKTTMGTLGSMFARLTGGKVLTDEDLKPILATMKEHLMKKNVAKDIADRVCDGVGKNLVGKKIGGFTSIKSSFQEALGASLTQILTPKTSTDVMQAIRTKLASPLSSTSVRSPYTMAFVGVNGVGKSTNLSKVCFWLIQNRLKVLIAACDTFRSGAVEQLRVHVRNLSMLTNDSPDLNRGSVELYEKGYGKDAAGIAKEAIAYAKENEFDVVLIDTAGRMQDNEPLMKALAKLVAINTPDKIIFVGEALVGNEAVDQLTKFDRALRDFSAAGSGGSIKGRGIDGMLVTKWDTVDDKVGAALSMTYVTGQPILFVGCGQTYTDLKQLRVANVVDALLAD